MNSTITLLGRWLYWSIFVGLVIFVAKHEFIERGEMERSPAGVAAMASDVIAAMSKSDILADELAKNPQILVDAIVAWGKEQQALSGATVQDGVIDADLVKRAYASDGAVIMGNPQGARTLVEFSDPNCQFCRMAVRQVLTLVDARDDIRLVMRELPIVADDSHAVSAIGLALANQGLYRHYLENLAVTKTLMTEKTALAFAAEIGADMARLEADRNAASTTAALTGNLDLAADLGVNGTPSFVLAGPDGQARLVVGVASQSWLADFLDHGAPQPSLNQPDPQGAVASPIDPAAARPKAVQP